MVGTSTITHFNRFHLTFNHITFSYTANGDKLDVYSLRTLRFLCEPCGKNFNRKGRKDLRRVRKEKRPVCVKVKYNTIPVQPSATDVAQMKTILGIDPGLNITGYGVIDVSTGKVRLLEAGVVRSRALPDTARNSDGGGQGLVRKVKEIYDGVREVIEMFSPEVMAMEELYSHYDRPRTAIQMGHARGCICLAAAQSDIAVVSYGATKVKKLLTGSGHATKDQVQRAIQLELGLEQLPSPADVADAIALALCHHYHDRFGVSNLPDAIKGNFPGNTVLR